jgi:hypothetical protein
MRSVHKAWPERSIATVAALALIVACIVGAYGHATGHAHHQMPHAAHALSGEVSVAVEPPHVDGEHEGADIGHAHADCYDFMCHGGHAILAGPTVILHPLRSTLFIPPTASPSSTQPNCLERPPKSPVLA